MTQAIGRACRYGQTKTVHIYNFLSLHTFEVDLVQLREGKVLINNEKPTPEILPFESFVPFSFVLVESEHGEKGEYGSAGVEDLLKHYDLDDAKIAH
jgi:hypothetical protein